MADGDEGFNCCGDVGQPGEVDPICWFTEMGHGPIPPDVKP